jgi:hypothetical protein
MTAPDVEVQRRQTEAFIAMDPRAIILTPVVETVTAGGGRATVAGTPRVEQTFKVIPMTFDQRPTVTAGGVERIIDYTLLGRWDAEGEVWDRFTLDGGAEYYQVVAISDGHQYEKKFLCERHLFKDGVA